VIWLLRFLGEEPVAGRTGLAGMIGLGCRHVLLCMRRWQTGEVISGT